MSALMGQPELWAPAVCWQVGMQTQWFCFASVWFNIFCFISMGSGCISFSECYVRRSLLPSHPVRVRLIINCNFVAVEAPRIWSTGKKPGNSFLFPAPPLFLAIVLSPPPHGGENGSSSFHIILLSPPSQGSSQLGFIPVQWASWSNPTLWPWGSPVTTR